MRSKVLVAVIFLGALTMVAGPAWRSWQSQPPDFSLYPAGDARKTAFFNYLRPLIDQENDRWLQNRARLKSLRESSETGKRDRLWLASLADFFDVPTDQPLRAQIDALLAHVDEVPRSLALAQAAKESAWGTSRFAVSAHNYFGQRCYSKGCGEVPDYRAPGAKFEVRRFDSPEASVHSYMNNINSHPEYEGFRRYRATQRAMDLPLSGIQAAEQLIQYSERRQAYVDEIQSLIHFNRLDQPIEATLDQVPPVTPAEATP
jgi:Bax protein